MHEMSIALGIVRIAEEEVRKRDAARVSKIEMQIGKLSGIEPDALDFAWPVAVKNTVLEKAERQTEYLPGQALCMDCEQTFEINGLSDVCPHCGSFMKNILQGREMKVVALTIEYEHDKN